MAEAQLWGEPRGHASVELLMWQKGRSSEAHVAPLNDLMERLRSQVDEDREVPLFDPAGGGVNARALMLLESPGPKSTDGQTGGSGIISPHNDDATAARVHQLIRGASLSPSDLLFWNIVPWWLPREGGGGTFRAPGIPEMDGAAPWLAELLSLLPRLEVVVLLGRKAETGWRRFARTHQHDVATISAPHPGPLVTAAHHRAATAASFSRLAGHLTGAKPLVGHLDLWSTR